MVWIHFGIGLVIGGSIGVFAMALMIAGSKQDDLLIGDKQYDETL